LKFLAHEFDFTEEKLMMYAIPNPDVPSQHQIVVAAKEAPESVSGQPVQRAIGFCVPSDFREGEKFDKAYIPLGQGFRTYIGLYEPKTALPPKDYKPDVKLAGMPTHGKIMQEIVEGETASYYLPDIGYLGDDKAVYELSYQGKTVNVVYVFKVTKNPSGGNDTSDIECGKKPIWKISTTPTTNPETNFVKLLNDANDAFTGFGDLAGTTVGETTGLGLSAQITFDSNAAGHGW
jgi:hypothetical protein